MREAMIQPSRLAEEGDGVVVRGSGEEEEEEGGITGMAVVMGDVETDNRDAKEAVVEGIEGKEAKEDAGRDEADCESVESEVFETVRLGATVTERAGAARVTVRCETVVGEEEDLRTSADVAEEDRGGLRNSSQKCHSFCIRRSYRI